MFVSCVIGDAGAVREAAERLVAGFDPDAVAVVDVPAVWAAFDALERLGAAGKVLVARRVGEGEAWRRAGAVSPAHHLARLGGTSLGAARAELETSQRLVGLAATAAAVRSGVLSRAQAEAVADGAAADPAKEAALLEVAAGGSLRELRETAAGVKAAADPDPAATRRRQHAGRELRFGSAADGSWAVHGRATPEDGSRIESLLGPFIDEAFRAARADGRREPFGAYRLDALLAALLAAATPATGATGTTATNATGADDTGAGVTGVGDPADDTDAATGASGETTATAGAPAGRRQPTHLALLRVDLEALVRGWVDGDEICDLPGVGPVSVPAARDLLGDSIIKLVITRGVDVVNVCHLGRGPTMAQRIALLWAQPDCTVEGCDHRIVQIDHRQPWAEVLETRLGNLDPLCHPHHDLKTTQGWELVDGTGKRAFVPPDDPRHPRHKRRRRPDAA